MVYILFSKINVLVLLLVHLGYSVPIENSDDELVAVVAVSRHGDRAPFTSFPTDRYYNLTYWPMGFGQITKKGIDRHYKLGQWLRHRYSSFLSEFYHSKEIYAWSTDIDRTLMSAYANLAGLYPPKGYQLWNEHISWQPIPVHIAPFLSLIENLGCPKFFSMLQKVKQTVFPIYEEKHSEILQYIANKTGWPKVSIEMVDELMDLLFTYEEHDLTFVPDWSKAMDHNITKHLSAIVYEIQTHTVPLARLKIGTFYDYLFNFFNKFVDPTSLNVGIGSDPTALNQKSKFVLVMAHESTLSAILNTIGAYNMKHIEYADTVLWELKKRKDGVHYLNVLFKTKSELSPVKILKCDYNCNLEQAKKSLADVTITKQLWHKECLA
ncbi:lysosomal acid phosphatase-like isoform X1 [Diabrotica undecimpunctata]|uniref:lysosomal acid phosphatase-like isoform X1 n=1 Tax=Diabrotica undecimpunctata TaxID=50387 RepID=UPI003B636C1D